MTRSILISVKKRYRGVILCLIVAFDAWFLGRTDFLGIVGGPILAILIGIILNLIIKDKSDFQEGIDFVAKTVLQYAVVLLGFGLNFMTVSSTGKTSLPIILATITTSLLTSFILAKVLRIPAKTATLIGVGSSICGGSAIAATAPVIDADDSEVAQSISVIMLFNVLAALIFPTLGVLLGFSPDSDGFAIFAGTAVNDTSSVTATAAAWDSMFSLGTKTLDTAITVKLTRTLAIIPITLFLSLRNARKNGSGNKNSKFSLSKVFPVFILFFIFASLITTFVTSIGVSEAVFAPFKTLSKFFIVMAMAGIGLKTDVPKLIRTGVKPIILGFGCWTAITIVSLTLQKAFHLW